MKTNARMIDRYYARGKLLISGEYLVLRGARALVLPLQVGQWMHVERFNEGTDPVIMWEAYANEQLWFVAFINTRDWVATEYDNRPVAERLVTLLNKMHQLNPCLFKSGTGYKITTHASFDLNLGLGSSSTLIANLAQWARIDPFELFFSLYPGSGYDVAAAFEGGAFFYQLLNGKPVVLPVHFEPEFRQQIWFVYQGNKQDTLSSIQGFNENVPVSGEQITEMGNLTEAITAAKNLADFKQAIVSHERMIGAILGREPVKSSRYPDFDGEIKSLGAWGGDMIMAVTDQPDSYVKDYFYERGLNTLFPFNALIYAKQEQP